MWNIEIRVVTVHAAFYKREIGKKNEHPCRIRDFSFVGSLGLDYRKAYARGLRSVS